MVSYSEKSEFKKYELIQDKNNLNVLRVRIHKLYFWRKYYDTI